MGHRHRWRSYFKNSASHNVILIDGMGQNDAGGGTNLAKRNHMQQEFDYVRGDYTRGFGKISAAAHSRAVVYLRGLCWIVFDRVTLDQPRTVTALWHFHPDCTVTTDGLSAASTDEGKGNLRIIPAGGPGWKLDIVKGQETPTIQGWYSPTYNVKRPNATAVYSAKLDKSATFAWALVPARGPASGAKFESLPAPDGAARVRLVLPGREPLEIAVRFSGAEAVPLSAGLELKGDVAILGLSSKPLGSTR
jgi:hypothetical protein